jgi:type IV pilus assembly protein PilC
MATFAYSARDRMGRSQQGTQDAASAAALAAKLRERGWLVLSVQSAAQEEGGGWRERWNPLAWLPVRSIDIEISLQQIAVMLHSGITLLAALKTAAEQARRLSMARVWERTAQRIQEGASLAEAMAEQKVFPFMVVQLIKVGEQTGSLEQVIHRASDSMERRRILRTQLLTAMTYPAIVLVAAIGVTTFMLVGVIPKLQTFLTTLGRRLPPMTQFLIDLSTFLQQHYLQIVIGIVGTIVGIVLVYLWPPGRLFLDQLILRIPITGRLLRLAATVQFSRGLGTLLRSGITLVEALRTVEQLHRNRFISAKVGAARNAVLRGGGLAPSLIVPAAFMPMLPRMVAVGETAGTLDDILDEIARFHENQLQGAIRQFSAIIEPVIVVLVGGIVGFVYISFFLALFAAAGGPR